MRSLLLLLFFIAFTSLTALCQPAFQNVVLEYFSRYSHVDPPYLVVFQKKKEGWYVARLDTRTTAGYSEVQQFWNKKTGLYNSLSYPKRDSTATVSAGEETTAYMEAYAGDYWVTMYRANAYYGYPGWDWDIITDFKDVAVLNDTLLEGLARAYSSYAIGFFMNQYGYHFINDDTDRTVMPDSISITASRKNKFIYYDTKAIETFKRLADQNPNYLTKVGTIAAKLANEHIFAWSNLVFAGYEKDAAPFLKNIEYPDSILQAAKDYFATLDRNAIFIASGDNDTYPLWYLQQMQNYRKDVTVLNYNLLGLRSMLAWVTKNSKTPLFKTPRSLYMKKDFDFAMYRKGDCAATPVLSKLPSMFSVEEGVRTYHCTQVIKPVLTEAARKMFPIGSFTSDMTFELPHFLYMSDYMLLDIIETNLFSRPIYFSWDGLFSSVQPYLVPEGKVFRVTPVK